MIGQVTERATAMWDDGARWHVGRVDRPPLEGEETYLVAFPDRRLIEVPGRELFTRWSCPLTDPLRLLGVRVRRLTRRQGPSKLGAGPDEGPALSREPVRWGTDVARPRQKRVHAFGSQK